MRKWLLAAVVLLSAGVVWWQLSHRRAPWTASSTAARREFEQGLEAELKFYQEDAVQHYRKTLELDPGMVMAVLRLIDLTPPRQKEDIARLIADLRRLRASAADRLTARERLLADYRLQRADRENARAEKTLAAYLEQNPNDPWALSIRCEQFWQRRDWAATEDCNRRLLKADPNWVRAQNQLGYIAMAQGRFAEAEQLFRTYLYIAPDQANPHDSMGELLTLLGRYADAERELEEAIRIRADFCPSWEHLILMLNLAGEPDKAHAAVERLSHGGQCGKDFTARQECRVATWEAVLRSAPGEAWDAASRLGCTGKGGEVSVLAYHAALRSGHAADAAQIETDMREQARLYGDDDPALLAVTDHLAGARLASLGDTRAAAARYRAADQRLEYWSDSHGLLKLFNSLLLSRSLRLGGDAAGADAVLERVRAVNADFARRFSAVDAFEP